MPSRLDYECKNGHRFERYSGKDKERCPECKTMAEILWLSPSSPHQQFSTPVVFWRYKDGSLGIAGGADSRTPKNAERVEARSAGEYRKLAKELNARNYSQESAKEARFQEVKSHMDSERRARLTYLMGQETNPLARDIYRDALERGNRSESFADYREYFSQAMEMDRSNRE